MSVFASSVCYVLGSILYTAAFACEQLGDLAVRFELEITVTLKKHRV